MGFNTQNDLNQHWSDHHEEFEPPPCSVDDYDARADAFMTCDKRPSMLECRRATGRLCRYDRATDEYGVIGQDGCLVTYFKPNPAIHGKGTNEAYFRAHC